MAEEIQDFRELIKSNPEWVDSPEGKRCYAELLKDRDNYLQEAADIQGRGKWTMSDGYTSNGQWEWLQVLEKIIRSIEQDVADFEKLTKT